MEGLPDEVLVRVLSTLGLSKDVHAVAKVSAKFKAAADDQALWKDLANRRYGEQIATKSLPMYDNSYKLMFEDDNRCGAMPTLNGVWKSAWRHNSTRRGQGSFYCCIVLSLKWNRVSNRILLYLDARGDSDLRAPHKSGVWLRDPLSGKTETLENRRLPPQPNADGSFYIHEIDNPDNVKECEFQSLLPTKVPGRYTGILSMDASLFTKPGSYQFCYANAAPDFRRDYSDCTLFTMEPGQSLMDVFGGHFSFSEDHPFLNETTAVYNERWIPHLPGAGDHDNPNLNMFGPWPECIGMTADECTRYIKSQNPDLSIQVFHPGQGMAHYYCASQVRFWVDEEGIVFEAPSRG